MLHKFINIKYKLILIPNEYGECFYKKLIEKTKAMPGNTLVLTHHSEDYTVEFRLLNIEHVTDSMLKEMSEYNPRSLKSIRDKY